MRDKLVIVESPAKARTISRFLGNDVRVLASMGHVRDLPENSLGVDVRHRFQPAYVLTRNGYRTVPDLKKAAATSRDIYLATDPDREGEAIAWHIQQLLEAGTKAEFHRVSFHEITRSAIAHAMESPGTLDLRKVDAQQARRVLDRLVGYQVSPMVWKVVRKGTSAGRVQSVALRLICEREREIQNFQPVEYWNLDAKFQPVDRAEVFGARLALLDGKKPQIANADAASALAAELDKAGFNIANVTRNIRLQRAPPPFITSTLQQAASASLRMGAGRTMRLAQDLYEGVELGSEGAVGLITYMRTDAVDVAREAQEAARQFIGGAFGADFVPERPNVYRSRQSAQAAHEAIRPTDVNRTPDSIAPCLNPDQLKLYRLIWNRFVASQMAPARMLDHTVDVAAAGTHLTHTYLFRAATSTPVFPGYLKVYDMRGTELAEPGEEASAAGASRLPDVPVGLGCLLKDLLREQCFTEPPKRFSEATLVKELEQNGIGRPSTYATIVETIQDREYVTKEKGRLTPTQLGFGVNDFLVAKLGDLFQVGFTAEMESELDEVEEGKRDWTAMLEEFYGKFQTWCGGGAAALTSAPENSRILRFLQAFPETVQWRPSVKRRGRTYDDGKFYRSLCEQAAGKKPISDKQWQAILALGARYADQIPGLPAVAEELHVSPQLAELIAREQLPAAERNPVSPVAKALGNELEPLFAALSTVTWEKPTEGKAKSKSRGRRPPRRYDDQRFFASLSEQVQEGKGLSDPQAQALKKLAMKYRDQIPAFADLAQRCNLDTATAPRVEPLTGEEQAKTRGMLELLGSIRQWAEPVARGRRTFDDREFAASVQEQFAKRQFLSPRQIAAIQNLLAKYHQQIPDYAGQVQRFGLPPPRGEAPPPLDVKCPQCGEPLRQRRARGRTFYGCSAYPKCRFASSQLPPPAAAAPA